jgi:hypothetical protein
MKSPKPKRHHRSHGAPAASHSPLEETPEQKIGRFKTTAVLHALANEGDLYHNTGTRMKFTT